MACLLLLPLLCGSVEPPAEQWERTTTNTAPHDDWERHRPIYHLTPASGHSNDPNGLFYDPQHGVYHVFVQWTAAVPQTGQLYWYHFASPDLVAWERVGVDTAHNVSGCSGGGVVAAGGEPTLVICGGSTAVPLNRSDARLAQWRQRGGDLTGGAYFPPEVPGKWDCSVARERSGRFRITFGSCAMAGGRLRPQQLKGYCDGTKQDGTPQILSYVSDDFATWTYLGEPWAHNSSQWPSPGGVPGAPPAHVPRVECPYQLEVAMGYGGGGGSGGGDDDDAQQLLKLSLAGTGKDYVFVGSTAGSNGSAFVAVDPAGTMLDHGSFYASAALADTRSVLAVGGATATTMPRQLLFGWVTNGYDLSKAVDPRFDCALSLPRVMGVVASGGGGGGGGGLAPSWEIAPEMDALRLQPQPLLLRNVTVPPESAVPLALPTGAAGDALELRLNFTVAGDAAAFGPVGFSVRATADTPAARSEQTLVFYGPSSAAHNGTGLEVRGTSLDAGAFGVRLAAPPLEPQRAYSLRVFVDKSVIESHVNGRLSATARAYPLSGDATHAFVINRGGQPVVLDSVELWGMRSIWQPVAGIG